MHIHTHSDKNHLVATTSVPAFKQSTLRISGSGTPSKNTARSTFCFPYIKLVMGSFW